MKFVKTKRRMTEGLAEVLLCKEGYATLEKANDPLDSSVVYYYANQKVVAILYNKRGVLAWNPKVK